MALVIEDGSGKSTATSYVTVDDCRTYAAARGVTLSATDGDVEELIIQAMDFLESLRDRYKGWKASEEQALQWPRADVLVDGFYVDSDSIPRELKNAAYAAVVELHNGEELLPNSPENGPTKSEKVGEISVTYENGQRRVGADAFAKPYAQLAPLMRRSGLQVVRA